MSSKDLLVGRLLTARGAAMSGQARIAGLLIDLDSSGRFSVQVPRTDSRSYSVAAPDGREFGVDAAGRPAVQAMSAGPEAGSLRLDYAGDPDMAGPDPVGAARADAVEARTAASAATAMAQGLASAMSGMTASLQALLMQYVVLAGRVSTLETRTVQVVSARSALPALAVNVAKTVDVTWAAPAVTAPQGVELFVEPLGSLLGSVTAQVVAGSVTTTGCQVRVSSTALVALGAGAVHVVGWLWT